jgi:DNA-binding SARP family transcriptional activator
MLKLELFGPGKAQYLNNLLNGFPNQHCYLLLCYLLLNRETRHSRERLASLFWAEDSPATSRKYLRNNFWRLRRALQAIGISPETYLYGDHDHIAFLNSSPYWLDVERFEEAVSRCQKIPGEALSPAQADHLQEAMGLYQGDLLQGIYEDWCLQDRERLRLMYLNGLSKLMVFHESHGTYEDALTCGERILMLDNVREKVHRRMMRLFWKLGDQDAAVAQYKRCVQILGDELGIPPIEKTRQLYQEIISGPYISDEPALVGTAETGNHVAKQDESIAQLLCQTSDRLNQLKHTVQEINREIKRLETVLEQLMAQQNQSTKATAANKTHDSPF